MSKNYGIERGNKLQGYDGFGEDTMVIGEATERVNLLNGMRVKVVGESECGTVYNTYVNRLSRRVQIWTNMDSGGARCFRPRHLIAINPTNEQSQLLTTDES